MPKYNILIEILSTHYRNFLILGLILGYLLAFSLKTIQPSLLVTSMVITIPIIITILVIPKFQWNDDGIFSINLSRVTQQHPKIFLILYTLGFTVSIIILYVYPYRPIIYFLLVCGLFILIFLQITSNNCSTTTILLEISLLMINIIYGVTLKYPYYFGMTDIFGHIAFSDYIYNYGTLIPPDYELTYANFPLFHILIATGTHIINLNIRLSYFLINGLIFLLTIPFLYLIFNNKIKNRQVSLLTCLLFIGSAEVIFYGAYFVTRTIAFIGFIILFYLLLRLSENKKNIQYLILANIIALFILLVHQVSILQIFFLLIIFIIIQYLVIYSNKQPIYFYFYFICIFITYWFYSAWDFLKILILSRTNQAFWADITPSNAVSSVSSVTSDSLVPFWLIDSLNWVLNSFNVPIFLFFALIGIGSLLKNKKSKFGLIFSIFSLSLIFFYIPSPLNSVWQYMRLLGFYRIALLVSPFMAFVMAYGVYIILSNKNNPTRNKKIYFITIALIYIFCFSSITTGLIARDNPDLWPDYWNPYFKTSELDSFRYIENYARTGENLIVDDIAARYFETEKYFSKTQELGIKWFSFDATPSAIQRYGDAIIIYRKEELFQKSILNFYLGNLQYSKNDKQFFENRLNLNNKLYSNEKNEIFKY